MDNSDCLPQAVPMGVTIRCSAAHRIRKPQSPANSAHRASRQYWRERSRRETAEKLWVAPCGAIRRPRGLSQPDSLEFLSAHNGPFGPCALFFDRQLLAQTFVQENRFRKCA